MDILVDLDGTLVDPKPGLIGSVQYALGSSGTRCRRPRSCCGDRAAVPRLVPEAARHARS